MSDKMGHGRGNRRVARSRGLGENAQQMIDHTNCPKCGGTGSMGFLDTVACDWSGDLPAPPLSEAKAMLPCPAWASKRGLDAYGQWATFCPSHGIQVTMRWIPPGQFEMGSPSCEPGRWDDEGPRHTVRLTRGFWMAAVPCTQDLWTAVIHDNPSRFRSPRRPVERVSFEQVEAFLEAISTEDARVLLPTEAEWEYACRAGTPTATYAGEMIIEGRHDAPILDDIAWYGGNSGLDYDLDVGCDSSTWVGKAYEHEKAGTRIVGLRHPNAWGLYDMLGNVHELCFDGVEWKENGDLVGYPSVAALRVDPVGLLGGMNIVRGGAWRSSARAVRAASRQILGCESDSMGFRFIIQASAGEG